MPCSDDEFAEFDTDEATFDAMMAEARPAELVPGHPRSTFTIKQAGDATFTFTVSSLASLSVETATSASNGGALVHGPGKLSAHRLRAPGKALAS